MELMAMGQREQIQQLFPVSRASIPGWTAGFIQVASCHMKISVLYTIMVIGAAWMTWPRTRRYRTVGLLGPVRHTPQRYQPLGETAWGVSETHHHEVVTNVFQFWVAMALMVTILAVLVTT